MADRSTRIQIAGNVVNEGDEIIVYRERTMTRKGEPVAVTRKTREKFLYAEDGIIHALKPEGPGMGHRSANVAPSTFDAAGTTVTEWVEVADRTEHDEDTAGGLVAIVVGGGWPDKYELADETWQSMGDDGARWNQLRSALVDAANSATADPLDMQDAAAEFLAHHDHCVEQYLSV